MKDIHFVVRNNLCMGCGLCAVDQSTSGVGYNRMLDCCSPINSNIGKESLASKICPGKGYPIVAMGNELYKDCVNDLYLGNYKYLAAAHSLDDSILEGASSGGIITQTLLYLLEKGIVDKVSVTQIYCDEKGVHTKSFLTNNSQDILDAQGSKYCPVDLSGLMSELHEFKGKVAIVATPCAIAGLRNIQKYAPEFVKSDIKFTIANFCGGFKSYKNIKRLAEIYHVNYYDLSSFRFRGGGQPGGLKFVENGGKIAQSPYPKYVGLTGYSKMHRCFVCPDATGELADISCGDAWIPRFENDNNPWSMVICRSEKAKDVVNGMAEAKYVDIEPVTPEEVKLSQRYNLTSKKTRQKARMRLYDILGKANPEYDGGYSDDMTSLRTELIVTFKHWLTLMAEKTGFYMRLYGYKKMNQ